MGEIIHRSEIDPTRWTNTTIFRLDGKEEFRELPQYGNRHAVFPRNQEWGEVHYDEHNATDFPVGTTRHLGKYTSVKTGLPENLATVGVALAGLYGLYKLAEYLDDD